MQIEKMKRALRNAVIKVALWLSDGKCVMVNYLNVANAEDLIRIELEADKQKKVSHWDLSRIVFAFNIVPYDSFYTEESLQRMTDEERDDMKRWSVESYSSDAQRTVHHEIGDVDKYLIRRVAMVHYQMQDMIRLYGIAARQYIVQICLLILFGSMVLLNVLVLAVVGAAVINIIGAITCAFSAAFAFYRASQLTDDLRMAAWSFTICESDLIHAVSKIQSFRYFVNDIQMR